jgi:hypothetical protein
MARRSQTPIAALDHLLVGAATPSLYKLCSPMSAADGILQERCVQTAECPIVFLLRKSNSHGPKLVLPHKIPIKFTTLPTLDEKGAWSSNKAFAIWLCARLMTCTYMYPGCRSYSATEEAALAKDLRSNQSAQMSFFCMCHV